MSIPVVCSCGKAMRAPDDWAGRDAKCPGCGQAVHIPGSGTAAATAPVKTGNPPVVPCPECGKPLMVPPGMAGKLVACPACGGHVRLPGKPAGVTAKAPKVTVPAMTAPGPRSESKPKSRKTAPAVATFEMDDPADDYDEDEEDSRAARRGKKRRSASQVKAGSRNLLLLCLLGGGGVLLVVGAIVAMLFLFGGGSGGSLIAMVPADVDAFGVIRVATLLRTPSGQKLRKLALDLQKDLNAKDLDNFQELVVFNRTGHGPVVIISTLVPTDVAITEKETAATHTKGLRDGKVYFAPKDPTQLGILFHQPRLLIMGVESDFADYLKQPPATAGPMAPTLRAAASDGSMIYFATHGAAFRKNGGAMGAMGPMGVPDADFTRVTINDGTRIVGNVSLDFSDADKATKAKTSLDGSLSLLRMTIPMQAKNMPPPMGDLVEKTLAKAVPTVSGSTVSVPVEIDMSMGDLAEKVQPMIAMMLMAGGGMGLRLRPRSRVSGRPARAGLGPGIPQPKNAGQEQTPLTFAATDPLLDCRR